ncbi:hypothetical protein HPB50_019155 [Hyalomma asiaticum]|uniref:Uncharacterized protein n=1 Tax=Hyalomma asiaticum TaxID=266040 RepID=A0ACB7S1Y8_HYAAI|nr:hypothetical protein HPB50_019155 [Hyalomma asiaticum]
MQVLRRVFDCLVVACICVAGLSLLPLLLVSLRARQWFFVRIMAVAGRLWRDVFEATRREAIAALDETESSDPELRADGAIRVLEIGAGSGANFAFLRRKVKYWNVDPNTEFQNFFLETVKKYPKVEMERWVVSYGEDMRDVPDSHFDAVIVTHLLCSVNSAEKVLQECRRVLVKVTAFDHI